MLVANLSVDRRAQVPLLGPTPGPGLRSSLPHRCQGLALFPGLQDFGFRLVHHRPCLQHRIWHCRLICPSPGKARPSPPTGFGTATGHPVAPTTIPHGICHMPFFLLAVDLHTAMSSILPLACPSHLPNGDIAQRWLQPGDGPHGSQPAAPPQFSFPDGPRAVAPSKYLLLMPS